VKKEAQFKEADLIGGLQEALAHARGKHTLKTTKFSATTNDKSGLAPAMKKGSFARNRTTAANLESRFEAGKDVFDYFDASRATVSHGDARPGAGPKTTGKAHRRGSVRPAILSVEAHRAESEADGPRRTSPPSR